MSLAFAPDLPDAIPLEIVEEAGWPARLAALAPAERVWAEAQGFRAALGSVLTLPDPEGRIARVLAGWGGPAERARGRFHLAGIAAKLPAASYRLATPLAPEEAEEAALGWLLGAYAFARYRAQKPPTARLVAPAGLDAARLEGIAAATALAQDLINTPAEDLGPAELEAAIAAEGARHGAQVTAIRGDDLLGANLPLVHAVGRAAARAPRLVDLLWGDPAHPRVTLVGKGVCFDTGGLDIKPASGMALMKKDMGGAATALALARLVMERRLPVRLRLLVPAVENAIAGAAFRPGDILRSRKGLTVEVNNTDAEGRLILADALALGAEERPDLLVSLATLTGAARVALGPDLPPFYTDDETLAADLAEAARAARDPLWRLPFWTPYEELIEPGIADLDNAPSGGMAGSVTAALFLRRFAGGAASFLHIDLFAWTPSAKPGRPKGGALQAARALLGLLEARHGRT